LSNDATPIWQMLSNDSFAVSKSIATNSMKRLRRL
jgi:hypothetical protein